MKRLFQVAVTTGLAAAIWVFPSTQKMFSAAAKAENIKDADSILIAQIDLQQVQQITQQNPQLIQQAQELLLQNPELLQALVQQMLQQNPQLLEQLEQNPQLVQQIAGQNQGLVQLLQKNPQLVQQLQQQIQRPTRKR